MTWDTIQQFLRIALYMAGSAAFGNGVADGAEYQALIGGVLAIGSFIWWMFFERDRKKQAARGRPL